MASNSNDFNPLSLIAAPISGAFQYAGGKAQADAQKYAVDKQTAAAKEVADQQDAANQRAEAFSRQQAESTWQNQEVDRQANYDQWAAKRRNIGSIGQMLGLGDGGAGSLPAYVPSVDPRYTTSTTPVPVGSGQTPSAAAATMPMGALGGALPGATRGPDVATFGSAMNRAPAPAAPTAQAPAVDPRLMGGNTGVVAPFGTPVLQPDGTYALSGSLPRYQSLGDYLGAA